MVPISRKVSPINTKIRSIALLRRFFSWKNMAPNRNETITLLRLIMDMIEIIDSLEVKAKKYV